MILTGFWSLLNIYSNDCKQAGGHIYRQVSREFPVAAAFSEK